MKSIKIFTGDANIGKTRFMTDIISELFNKINQNTITSNDVLCIFSEHSRSKTSEEIANRVEWYDDNVKDYVMKKCFLFSEDLDILDFSDIVQLLVKKDLKYLLVDEHLLFDSKHEGVLSFILKYFKDIQLYCFSRNAFDQNLYNLFAPFGINTLNIDIDQVAIEETHFKSYSLNVCEIEGEDPISIEIQSNKEGLLYNGIHYSIPMLLEGKTIKESLYTRHRSCKERYAPEVSKNTTQNSRPQMISSLEADLKKAEGKSLKEIAEVMNHNFELLGKDATFRILQQL